MKLKSIKSFLNCKESIIRVEVVRYMLNQERGKMSDVIFCRLWIESDIMLNKEINKLKDMLTDDLSDYETCSQLTKIIADKAAIKNIVYPDENALPVNEIADYPDENAIPVNEIAGYIEQDIYEKTNN